MTALNQNLIDTGSPPVPAAQGWISAYDGRLGPLINLSQAAPADPPHADFMAALAAAALDPASARYGDIHGDAALREAYAADVSALHGARLTAADVAITTGANQAFFIAMLSVARAGENLLLPAPWYFNHQMACAMLGIEARALPCPPGNGFLPDADAAARLIDERTRAIVLVTPNNPTGAVYPPELIQHFADLCARRGLWLILDRTYRDFPAAGNPAGHNLFRDDAWRDHLIELYSFSKAYCIPGYRLGAMTGGPAVLREAGKIFDTLQICPPRIGQIALAPAIARLAPWRRANAEKIARRAAMFQAAFDSIEGWRIDSIGAYFAYVRHPFAGVPSEAVAAKLAGQRGVLGLPGSFFGPGQEQYLRLAFANAGDAAIAALPGRFQGLEM